MSCITERFIRARKRADGELGRLLRSIRHSADPEVALRVQGYSCGSDRNRGPLRAVRPGTQFRSVGGTPSLIVSEPPRDGNSSVYGAILNWRDAGFATMFVKEVGPDTVYLYPAADDRHTEGCIVRMDLVNTPEAEIAATVNLIISAVRCVWVYDDLTGERQLLAS